MTPSFKQNYFYTLMLIVLALASFCIGKAFRDPEFRTKFENNAVTAPAEIAAPVPPPVTAEVNIPVLAPPLEEIVVPAPPPPHSPAEWTVKEPSQAVEFITGPLVADVGQLCVFRLNAPDTRADWIIVPEATCYVDSSGSSLAFASNTPAKYTIVAAVVEEGVPKILTHVCEYGLQPQPDPSPNPSPNPDPTPTPGPKPQPPVQNLSDWVSQNVPDAGRGQCAALAACYESAANGIESGSIRSQEAAYSAIRTATQSKVNVETWGNFLDALSVKVAEKLDGDTDVKKLGTIFTEIVSGLKTVSEAETPAEPEVSVPVILPFPTTTSSFTCPDPTGKACQPQPTIQYRRRAR